MHVKLFSAWDIKNLEEEMNDFLADYDKEEVLNMDVKVNLIYNQTEEQTNHYYTGIVCVKDDDERGRI